MLDLRLFRNRSFVGASIAAFVLSAAMFAMFLYLTLYIQNILGYSPLEAGIRFLPTTLVIMFVAPIAGRLTDRIGPRPLIVAGLGIVAVSLFMQSQIDVTSTYSTLLVPFILMGLGIALTMSPMSTAAMNAVANEKAGLASGLLSMSRMVGGTFGVAVLGAIFQSQGHSSLESSLSGLSLPARQVDSLTEQLGSGGLQQTIDKLPADQAGQVADAAREAFISSLSTSIGISAAVAAAGALLAVLLISKKSAEQTLHETPPDAAGIGVPVPD